MSQLTMNITSGDFLAVVDSYSKDNYHSVEHMLFHITHNATYGQLNKYSHVS